MNRRRQTFTLRALRADATQFVCLCIMVLALPFLHPLAEARAAQNGLSDIICTQFGLATSAGDEVPIGAADDGPCVILCGGTAAGKTFKALAPGTFAPLSNLPFSAHAWTSGQPDSIHSNLLSGKTGIRGPPHLI